MGLMLMSQINGTNNQNTLLRIDTSRVNAYLGPEAPKKTFGQKIGNFFKKAAAIIAPIAGAVLPIVAPGIGVPLSAACYGLGKFSSDSLAKGAMRDNIDMQNQMAAMQNMPITMPGLFENNNPAMKNTSFIAPSQFNSQISTTIVNKEMSRGSALGNF